MENLFARHRNVTVLVAMLFAQILGLAMQVKRADPNEPTRQTPLLRQWVVGAVTPVEKMVAASSRGLRNTWNNYVNLRSVRDENHELKAQVERMKLEQARLQEESAQARRLQALLRFKEQMIAQTLAAQVIGSSGTEQSRLIYIDKGTNDGLAADMPVITPDGVVGKVVQPGAATSGVLLITDPAWGVGGVLEKTRLQGIAKGTASGDLKLANILADEKVEVGERVLTSGGDRIFPKGLPLARVSELLSREDLFLNIRLKPAANLQRLEEVLIITRMEERAPEPADTASGPVRAADVLAQRLPSVKKKEAPPAENRAKKPAAPPDAARPAPEAGTAKPNQQQQQEPPAKPVEATPRPQDGDTPR
jgi:rod shape-determining protein MreC